MQVQTMRLSWVSVIVHCAMKCNKTLDEKQ